MNDLKICVIGPLKTGKTLLCRALAEQPVTPGEYGPTAAVRCEQPAFTVSCSSTLHASQALVCPNRIQEYSRTIGVDRVKVQFWDCSGNAQYQAYWPVLCRVSSSTEQQLLEGLSARRSELGCDTPLTSALTRDSAWAQDIDGVILVLDPQHPEQERELEQFYMNFAQPNNLTTKQCFVLAIQVVKEGSYGLGGWQGASAIITTLCVIILILLMIVNNNYISQGRKPSGTGTRKKSLIN